MYTYYIAGFPVTDALYHEDLEGFTFGRRDQNELWHYGIKGQSWGKRRFQNEDGSLTAAGKQRYDVGDGLQGAAGQNGNILTRSGRSVAGTFAKSNGAVGTTRDSYNAGGGLSLSKHYGASSGSSLARSNQMLRTVGPGVQGIGRARTNASSNPQSTGIVNKAGIGRDAVNSVFGNVAANAPEQKSKKPSLLDRVGNAASAVGNWGRERAQDVAEGATRAYEGVRDAGSKAVDWVGDQAQNAGKAVSGAVGRARDAAGRAVDWAGNAAQNVGNAAGKAAQDVGDAATRAYEGARDAAGRVADWAGNTAQNAYNAVSNQDEKRAAQEAQEKAERQYMISMGRSGYVTPDGNEYIGRLRDSMAVDRADKEAADAQRAYESHPLTKAGNAIDAARGWVGDQARSIGEGATRAYEGAKDAAGRAVDWAGNAARNVAGGVRDAAQNVGYEVQGLANTPEARDAAAAVNSAIDWAGNTARNVAGGARDAAGRAVDWAGDQASSVGEGATRAYEGARDWVGGLLGAGKKGAQGSEFSNAQNEMPENPSKGRVIPAERKGTIDTGYQKFMTPSYTQWDKLNGIHDSDVPLSSRTTWTDPNDHTSEYEDFGVRYSRGDYMQPTDFIRENKKDGDLDETYQRAITPEPSRYDPEANISMRRTDLRGGHDNAMKYMRGGHVNDVGVDKPSPNMVPDHGRGANDQPGSPLDDKYGGNISRNWDNRGPNQLSSPSPAPSEKPTGVSDEYWQEYTANGGTRDSWDAARQAQGNSQRQAPATPSDKPTGVSDEYWQEYTANGGTPESYARERQAQGNSQRQAPATPSGKPSGVSDEYWQEYTANGGTPESYNREHIIPQGGLREQYITEERIPEQYITEERIPEQVIQEQMIPNVQQSERGRRWYQRIFG